MTRTAPVLLALLIGSACSVSLDLPEGARISCEGDQHCPEGTYCQIPPGLCVRDDEVKIIESRPELRLLGGRRDLTNGATVIVGGSGEPQANVVSARLLHAADGTDAQLVPASLVTVDRDGQMHGSFVAAGLVDGARVALEVVLEFGGAVSVADNSRSLPVDVDLVSPDSQSVTVDEGEIVPSVAIHLTLAANGADEIFVTGDLAASANVEAWIPYAAQLAVALSAGDGSKIIAVDFRDFAHNQVSDTVLVTLDTSEPISLPILESPWGVARTKSLDPLTVAGQVEAAAELVSATLVSFDATAQELATCAIDVTGQVEITGSSYSGSLSLGTPCALAESVALRAIVRNSAGTLSSSAASTSPSLVIDNQAPTMGASVLTAALAEAGFTPYEDVLLDITAAEPAGSGCQIRITGDVQSTNRTMQWVGFPGPHIPAGQEPVLLLAGDGDKTILVEARDLVGNEATPVTLHVTLDSVPPGPPLASSLLLVETSPAPLDPAQIDDSNNAFVLTGLAGAVSNANRVEVYSDEGLQGQPVTTSVGAGGEFAALTLAHNASETYYVIARDQAGNPSTAATQIPLPQLDLLLATPTRVGLGQSVSIAFTSSMALTGEPSVTVDGNSADFVSANDTDYAFSYTTTGSESQGVDNAVVRVVAEPVGFASGTSGTSAITLTLDLTPPAVAASQVVITESAPGADDSISGASGAVSDNMDPADAISVAIYDPTGTLPLGSGMAAADGSFEVFSIGDNAYDSVLVVLTDTVGNEGAGASFENDRTPPTAFDLVIDPAAQRHGQPVQITFSVSDDSRDLDDDPMVLVAGRFASWVSGSNSTSDLTSHPFAYTFDVDEAQDPEGIETVEIVVTDTAGNTGLVDESIWLDFSPPTSNNTEPGVYSSWNGLPALVGAAADNLTDIALVEVGIHDLTGGNWWNGSSFGSAAETWLAADGTASWAYDVSSVPWIMGQSYELQWRAMDTAGNVETPVPVTVTLASIGPDAPTALTADAGREAEVHLSWSAPAQAVDHYLVHYDLQGSGAPPFGGSGAEEGASPITVNGATTSVDVRGLPPGWYTFAVTAIDSAGSSSTWSGTADAASRWWRVKEPAFLSGRLRDVTVLAPGVFLAVGDAGAVWRSRDGGATWDSTLVSDLGLLRVWGEGDTVFAVGKNQVIVRSLDGGSTWETVDSASSNSFWVINGDGETVIAAGQSRIVYSEDGGDTWDSANDQTFEDLSHLWRQDNLLLLAGDSGVISRSEDSGRTWSLVPTGGLTAGLGPIADGGSYLLVVASNGSVLRSTDLGQSFSEVSAPATSLDQVWTDGTLAVAAGSGGTIVRSQDGGLSWESAVTATSNAPRSIWGTADNLIVVGDSGTILRSNSRGRVWDVLESGTEINLVAVAGSGADVVAVGSDSGAFRLQGTIVRALNNSGASWEALGGAPWPTLQALWDDGTVIVAVGYQGAIWRSTDRGESWSPIPSPTDARLEFVAGTGGALVAAGQLTMIRSVDSGQTWIEVDHGVPYEFLGLFCSSNNCIGTSYFGRLAVSNDGGATFSQRIVNSSMDWHAVWGEGDNWVIVGTLGALAHSTNGGSTWVQRTSGVTTQPKAVWGVGNTVVAVGDSGALTVSTDGGDTWVADSSVPSVSYKDVWGDATAFLAVGPDTILRSVNSGADWSVIDPGTTGTFGNIVAAGDDVVLGYGLLESVDHGLTWSPIARFYPAVGLESGFAGVRVLGSNKKVAVAGGIFWAFGPE